MTLKGKSVTAGIFSFYPLMILKLNEGLGYLGHSNFMSSDINLTAVLVEHTHIFVALSTSLLVERYAAMLHPKAVFDQGQRTNFF